jgi:hypothetical protein
MPVENPKYDVAISFLSEDQTLASAIYGKLSEGLKVFFYPHNQEDLAGTDGLESMRKPFFDGSRVVVVLYREKWGKTPWTRVEQTAIEDSFLKYGWERLFFIVLDKSDVLPAWVPQHRVRYNLADFGLDHAVGAIKARVQDQGGKHMPMTATKKAEIFQADELFRRDKSRMNSEAGIKAINESVAELFHHIERQCADINAAKGFLQIQCEVSLKEGNNTQDCGLTNGQVGLTVTWNQPYASELTRSALVIREYKFGLIFPSQLNRLMPYDQPRPINEAKYVPDLSRTREYGWRQDADESEFVSSATLAEQIVMLFVGLANRKASGKLK